MTQSVFCVLTRARSFFLLFTIITLGITESALGFSAPVLEPPSYEGSTVNLTWTDSTPAAFNQAYQLWRAEAPSGTWRHISPWLATAARSFQDIVPDPNQTYHYWLRSCAVINQAMHCRCVGGACWQPGPPHQTIGPDQDQDTVPDSIDNCVYARNVDQADANADGLGDACQCYDFDNDGYPEPDDWWVLVCFEEEPCFYLFDLDLDGDLDWDDEDVYDDHDWSSGPITTCPANAPNFQETFEPEDNDNDLVLDYVDNCTTAANPSQADFNNDGIGDACDPDGDGDGVSDFLDNCPTIFNPDQANADGDAFGDLCEPDTDLDGVIDDYDNCVAVSNAGQANGDGDAFGDACDLCPSTFSTTNNDLDEDGYGDACDACPVVSVPGASAGDDCYDALQQVVPGQEVFPICEGNIAGDSPTVASAISGSGYMALNNDGCSTCVNAYVSLSGGLLRYSYQRGQAWPSCAPSRHIIFDINTSLTEDNTTYYYLFLCNSIPPDIETRSCYLRFE